ncbi:hypothetical protein LPJ59_002008 [Coemansia sp. RSA 2399]|nr:hypothetical protein LPJ59_002008 [Coemansia sp. RSA 2399]KAJ1905565.1 hypothetical protein LPJ81_001855 [Coemansia sp. IMI 209127]
MDADGGDSNEKHGLSQSDFRRLLSQNTNAQKRQKRVHNNRRDKHPAQQQPTTASSKRYRDRAAERRVGADYDGSDAKTMTYDESKFLGGDVERTHLVKGLDYLLLEKNRPKEDTMLEQHAPAETDATITELGKRVLSSVCRSQQTLSEQAGNVAKNDLFAPGRMYFEFDTSAACAITVRIRSQEEIAMHLSSAASASAAAVPEGDWLVLSKVIAAISKPKPKTVQDKVPTEAGNHHRKDIPAAVIDDDDIFEDIFEDAGI